MTGPSRAALDSRVRTAVLGAIRAEDGHWSIGSPLADRVMEALGPVLDEAEAGRAKLAAVEERCRKYAYGARLSEVMVTAADILAIISSEGESRG